MTHELEARIVDRSSHLDSETNLRPNYFAVFQADVPHQSGEFEHIAFGSAAEALGYASVEIG